MLIAAGSIGAAAVLAVLAVLGIALQVLARYSWAVIRDVLPAWFAPIVGFAVLLGVVLPLWVSFAPTPRASKAAFVGFGWAMISVGLLGKIAAKRMSPSSLALRARTRALVVLSAADPDRGELDDLAALLRQVIAEDVPLWGDGQRTVGVYALLIAALSRREDGRAAAADATRALAGRADGSANPESGADSAGIVKALWVLALDQVRDEVMFAETHRAVTTIAANARARAHVELAELALAALTDTTSARICALQPRVGFTVPRRPEPLALETVPVKPGEFFRKHFAARKPASGLEPLPEQPQTPVEATRPGRRGRLTEFLARFGNAEEFTAEAAATLLQLLHGALPSKPRHVDGHDSQAYDLLKGTVGSLTGLLPPPMPSSSGWPSPWAGSQSFGNDISRLADVAERAYLESREVPTDAAEETLEGIGLRLLDEQTPDAKLPPPRTLWREPPSHHEEGGISGPLAEAFGRLMTSAYQAGFDRRALRTGLRLIALATVSVERDNLTALRAYAHALNKFTRDGIRNGPDGLSASANARAQAILTCLVSECDQLLRAAYQNGRRDVGDAVEEIAKTLVWATPPRRADQVAAALVQVRVMAGGWPVDLPSGQPWSGLSAPPDVDAAAPLGQPILQELRREFDRHAMDANPHSMALALALWAHAILAARRSDSSAVGDIENCFRPRMGLTRATGHHTQHSEREPAHHDQAPPRQITGRRLRAVAFAALTWCENGDPKTKATCPPGRGPSTVAETAEMLLADDTLENWLYCGSRDIAGPGLVTVRSADSSRRVLRNADLRADDFSWGYGGSGPHELAEALIRDLLGKHIACPSCLGAITVAAHVIECPTCENSGERRGAAEAAEALVDSVISSLPNDFSLTRRDLLKAVVDQPG